MAIEKRMRRDRNGDPVLLVTVTGFFDIFRFAEHMRTGQVEFARLGVLTLDRCKAWLGAARFRQMWKQMFG